MPIGQHAVGQGNIQVVRNTPLQRILAGGGLYNNLDYSFVAGHEDGAFVYPKTQPGGGNPSFRKQLRVLTDFIHSFDFVHMKPDTQSVRKRTPASVVARTLSQPGAAYAIYLRAPTPIPTGEQLSVELDLPSGRYTATWIERRKARGVEDAKNDEARLRDHVLCVNGLGDMVLDDVRPKHLVAAFTLLQRVVPDGASQELERAFGVYGSLDGAFDELVRDFLNDGSRLLGLEERGRFRFWDPSDLRFAVGSAGFVEVQSRLEFGDPPQAVVVGARRLARRRRSRSHRRRSRPRPASPC